MLPVLLALLAVTGVGAGGFVLVGNASEANAECEGSVTVRLAAAAEIAPVLGEATRDLEADGFGAGGACVDYDLEIAAPEQVAETLSDPEKAPDLWAPDLSVWLSQAALSGSTPVTVSQSLAKSPVVVVGRDAAPPASWREVGMNSVAYLDPLTSSASTVALLSAFGEMAVTGATEAELGAMMPRVGGEYERALEISHNEFERLEAAGLPEAAPYALCLGYRIRYVLDLNAREAMHLCELRSGREGHPTYRAVAQAMHELHSVDVLQGVRVDTTSARGMVDRRSDSAYKGLVSVVNYRLIRTLFRLPLGERVLLHPGDYTVAVLKEGYYPQQQSFAVGDEPSGTVSM